MCVMQVAEVAGHHHEQQRVFYIVSKIGWAQATLAPRPA